MKSAAQPRSDIPPDPPNPEGKPPTPSAAHPRYVQLDPSLTDDDLLALGAKRDQLPLYHRMQKYGAWVVDQSDCGKPLEGEPVDEVWSEKSLSGRPERARVRLDEVPIKWNTTANFPWEVMEPFTMIDWPNAKIEKTPHKPYKPHRPPRFRWLRSAVTRMRYSLACWINPYEMDEYDEYD